MSWSKRTSTTGLAGNTRAKRRSRWARTFSRISLAVRRVTRAGRSSVGQTRGHLRQRGQTGRRRTVTADDQYIRNSILNPASQIVEGYQPIMPTFKGQVTEEQLNGLVAYMKSLSGVTGAIDGRRDTAAPQLTRQANSPVPTGKYDDAAESGSRQTAHRAVIRMRRHTTAIDRVSIDYANADAMSISIFTEAEKELSEQRHDAEVVAPDQGP